MHNVQKISFSIIRRESDFKHAILGNAVMVLSITHYRHAGDNDITRERSR
jgi:hypothetical protein